MKTFYYLGDFNFTKEEQCVKDFCETYNLENLITEPNCFKHPDNPSSIDVILANRVNSFQNSMTIETGLRKFIKKKGNQ